MDGAAPAILLVEDSDSDAVLIEHAFRKARIRNPFLRMSSGQEALDYFNGHGKYEDRKLFPLPIFTLLDLHLPDVSGMELLHFLQGGSHSAIPVVVVADSCDPYAEQNSLALGASAYFKKQLSFENLVELVHSIGGFWNLRAQD